MKKTELSSRILFKNPTSTGSTPKLHFDAAGSAAIILAGL